MMVIEKFINVGHKEMKMQKYDSWVETRNYPRPFYREPAPVITKRNIVETPYSILCWLQPHTDHTHSHTHTPLYGCRFKMKERKRSRKNTRGVVLLKTSELQLPFSFIHHQSKKSIYKAWEPATITTMLLP